MVIEIRQLNFMVIPTSLFALIHTTAVSWAPNIKFSIAIIFTVIIIKLLMYTCMYRNTNSDQKSVL